MTIQDNDWRLMGQEKYLFGATLYLKKLKQESEQWDHEHCAFCNVNISERKYDGAIQEGYTIEDQYHWVCGQCARDFQQRFAFMLIT